MKNENFTYSFMSSKSPKDIFALLLQIPEWWSGIYEETITGKSEQPGDEFSFLAGGGVHYTKQRLEELIPDKRVVWQVTDSNLTFLTKTDEWTGTRLCFDIAPNGNKTAITFTHEGLVPDIECYEQCSGGWLAYLRKLENKLTVNT